MVRTRPVAAAIAILVAGASLVGCGSTPTASPNVATLLGAGSAAYKQSDFNGSVQLFERAVAEAPTNATARYDLGLAYQAEHLDHDALVQYRRALAVDPDLVPAMYNMATIYSTGNRPLAIYYYRKVISMKAATPSTFLGLGLAEAQQGLQATAGVDLREAVQLDPGLRSSIPPAYLADLSAPAPLRDQSPSPSTTSSP